MVNAEDFAFDGRLDYEFLRGSRRRVGLLRQPGDNRPKDDLDVDAPVDLRPSRRPKAGRGRCARLYGGPPRRLRGVTLANRNLSNNLNVKRTPVASDAQACSRGRLRRRALARLPQLARRTRSISTRATTTTTRWRTSKAPSSTTRAGTARQWTAGWLPGSPDAQLSSSRASTPTAPSVCATDNREDTAALGFGLMLR